MKFINSKEFFTDLMLIISKLGNLGNLDRDRAIYTLKLIIKLLEDLKNKLERKQ